MEAQIAEKLRVISHWRKSFLSFVQQKAKGLIVLESNWAFHSVLLFSSLALVLAVFGAIRSLTVFSLHPLCMIIGVFLFTAEGIASYRNHTLLEVFGPIMQHGKRLKVRAIHQATQTIGAIFIFLGLIFILLHKTEIQHDILPRSAHSLIACFTILIVVVQVISGKEKFEHFLQEAQWSSSSSQSKIRRWHGDLGLLLWDLLCVTMASGLITFLPWSFTSLLVCTLPFLVWLCVALQVQGKVLREEAAHSHPSQGSANNESEGLGLGRSASFDGKEGVNASPQAVREKKMSTPRRPQRKQLTIEENVDYDSQDELLYAVEVEEEEFNEGEEEDDQFMSHSSKRLNSTHLV